MLDGTDAKPGEPGLRFTVYFGMRTLNA